MHDLKQLENDLWEAADQLRANSRLTAGEYSMPVLGLIFLRQATNRFYAVKHKVEAQLPSRGGLKRPLTPDDFRGEAALYLPEPARYDSLVNLPEDTDISAALVAAMEQIEAQSAMLSGALPKEYTPTSTPPCCATCCASSTAMPCATPPAMSLAASMSTSSTSSP